MGKDQISTALSPERASQITVVASAYDSFVSERPSYLSMPVTTGPDLYRVLEKYGTSTVSALEKRHPGVLLEEVILPNIENGRRLAERIHQERGRPVVVPGIFDAKAFGWSQREYMVLWLRLISTNVSEIFLSPGWEYSTGIVKEFVHGMMIQCRFTPRRDPIIVYNENISEVDLTVGTDVIAHAIYDLRRRGFDVTELMNELRHLADLALTLSLLAERDQMRWEWHVAGTPSVSYSRVLETAYSLDIMPKSILC